MNILLYFTIGYPSQALLPWRSHRHVSQVKTCHCWRRTLSGWDVSAWGWVLQPLKVVGMQSISEDSLDNWQGFTSKRCLAFDLWRWSHLCIYSVAINIQWVSLLFRALSSVYQISTWLSVSPNSAANCDAMASSTHETGVTSSFPSAHFYFENQEQSSSGVSDFQLAFSKSCRASLSLIPLIDSDMDWTQALKALGTDVCIDASTQAKVDNNLSTLKRYSSFPSTKFTPSPLSGRVLSSNHDRSVCASASRSNRGSKTGLCESNVDELATNTLLETV